MRAIFELPAEDKQNWVYWNNSATTRCDISMQLVVAFSSKMLLELVITTHYGKT